MGGRVRAEGVGEMCWPWANGARDQVAARSFVSRFALLERREGERGGAGHGLSAAARQPCGMTSWTEALGVQ